MADVTLAVRARKWLEDPETDIADVDRAFLNALLAIATAEREVATEIRQLSNRVEQCFDEAFGLCKPKDELAGKLAKVKTTELAIEVRKGEAALRQRGVAK